MQYPFLERKKDMGWDLNILQTQASKSRTMVNHKSLGRPPWVKKATIM